MDDIKIDIKKIIRPWYFAGFSCLTALIVCILFIMAKVEYRKAIEDERESYAYFKNTLSEQMVLTQREKFLKYTDFYYKLISWYGEKHQSGRGMRKEIKTDFVVNSYNYETWLNLPRFYFISKGKIETDYNPKAKGALSERGIFQHMPTADVIGTAYYGLKLLYIERPGAAKKLEFYYQSEKDLEDPLNALKIEALLAYHNKRKFNGELIYWISAVHWGDGRIYNLHKNKLRPIWKKFDFTSKKTAEKYSRSPLMYYFVWAEHWNAFSHFRKDVNIDKGWIKAYKEACSKSEKDFIEGYKFYQKALNFHDEIKEKIGEVEKVKIEYYELIKEGNKEYKRFLKLMKQKKYKNITREIFIPARIYFDTMYEEIKSDEISIKQKMINISYIGILIIMVLLSIGFFILVILRIKGKRYGNKTNKASTQEIYNNKTIG